MRMFQSTLSVRRATSLAAICFAVMVVSIHALREESDLMIYATVLRRLRFQSTLSVRRATNIAYRCLSCIHVSIHALREESDVVSPRWWLRRNCFNPRSP